MKQKENRIECRTPGSESLSDAVAMIHATPASARSSFAREIWKLRQEHGTDHNQDEVPF
jgi:hypothetical protein